MVARSTWNTRSKTSNGRPRRQPRFALDLREWSLRDSNPLLKFRDVAQFRHKYAAASALTALSKNTPFAQAAQNYAVPLSESYRWSQILNRSR
jgi:hypothetical protein